MIKMFVVPVLLMISLASMIPMLANGNEISGNHISIETPAQIVTKKEPVRAKLPRIAKPKIFRSNPHRAVYYAIHANDLDDIGIDDDDKITGYRKRDLQRLRAEPTKDDPDGFITDDIKWRLFLARTAAVIRHRQIHG